MKISFSGQEFNKIFKLKPMCAKDRSRFNGVWIEQNKATVTDSYRLVSLPVKMDKILGDFVPFLLPSALLEKSKKIVNGRRFNLYQEVIVEFEDKKVSVTIGNMTKTLTVDPETFCYYQSLFPKEGRKPERKIGFNAKFLSDMAKALNDNNWNEDRVTLEIYGDGEAIIVNKNGLLMPLKVED
jgi:hypothetical protein